MVKPTLKKIIVDEEGTVSHVRRHSSGLEIIDVADGSKSRNRSSQGNLPPSITPESLSNLFGILKQRAIDDGTYRGECPSPCPTDCVAYNPNPGVNICGRFYRVEE